MGEGQLGVGRMGNGGQGYAARIWGLEPRAYMHKADPWPLNPEGELFLGLKIENKRALANTEESLAVPGIAFAEWGPGDMGLSLGFVDRHDPPYPPEMQAARARVLAGCKANNVAFLNQTRPPDVVDMIAEGVRVGVRGPGGRGDRAPAHRAHHALVVRCSVLVARGGPSARPDVEGAHWHVGASDKRLSECGGLRPRSAPLWGGGERPQHLLQPAAGLPQQSRVRGGGDRPPCSRRDEARPAPHRLRPV